LEQNLSATAALEAEIGEAPQTDHAWFIQQPRMASYSRPDSTPLEKLIALAEKFE